jgi:hypothetical protein
VICGLVGAANDTPGAPLGPDFAGTTTWLATAGGLAIAANVFVAAFQGYGKWRVLATVLAAAVGCATLLIGGSTGLLDRGTSRWLAIAWTLATAVLGAWLGTRSGPSAAERADREHVESGQTPPPGS